MNRTSHSVSASNGFSLLEVVLAVFIFSVIAVGITTYFANITLANQNTKRLQQNLEDTRFAMNRIAKVLRTSVAINPNAATGAAGTSVQTIRIYDYSQSSCIEYAFSSGGMNERTVTLPVGTVDEKVWCATGNPAFSPWNALVSASGNAVFEGRFFVVSSEDTSPNERAGRVVMNARIRRGNNESTMQTTVSLRNYEEVYP